MFSLNSKMLNKDNPARWPRLPCPAAAPMQEVTSGALLLNSPFKFRELLCRLLACEPCLLRGHKGTDISLPWTRRGALRREQSREQWPTSWLVNKPEWGLCSLRTRLSGRFQCFQPRITVPWTQPLLRVEKIKRNSVNYGTHKNTWKTSTL